MNLANMNSPTHGRKLDSFENLEAEHPAWATPATNFTHAISEKLLDWGVEMRGAYCMLTSNPGRP